MNGLEAETLACSTNEKATATVMEIATREGSTNTQATAGRYDCIRVQTPAPAAKAISRAVGIVRSSKKPAAAPASRVLLTEAYKDTHNALTLPRRRSQSNATAFAKADRSVEA